MAPGYTRELGAPCGVEAQASFERIGTQETSAEDTPGSSDNGNVVGITNNRDTTRTQSFTYDQVNRIVTAGTSSTTGSNCWGETYAMEQWANLTTIGALSGYTGCTQEGLSVTATTNNQLSSTGFSYDASGNMLTDGVNTYGWNAESEIKSAAGVNYTYASSPVKMEISGQKRFVSERRISLKRGRRPRRAAAPSL